MPEYRFLTTWLLQTEVERVWDAIYDSERWPEWWKGVLEADKLEEGDERGRPVRPLRLEVEASLRLEFFVGPPRSSGPPAGASRASWRASALALFEQAASRRIYEWNVRTTRPG
jgi:uncharacterized protein YndB with AHSA1/START domain